MWLNGTWNQERSHYDRLLDLPRPGWGWEFARRSPELRRAALHVRPNRRVLTYRSQVFGQSSTLTRLRKRCRAAEAFGLHFFPDPALSAFDTTVFWLPEVMRSGLDATLEFTSRTARTGRPLRLFDLPGRRHYLIGPGRRPKLIIASPAYSVQLAIANQALALPRAPYLSLRLGEDALLGQALTPVEAFAQFCGGQTVSSKPLRGLSPEALRKAIIALDGELAGIPRRRIARVIYGKRLIREVWDRDDQTYKKRTKRLVEKGVRLMERGYKALL